MKAILYVGGAFMVAASIYGFIDYKRTSHDKDFKNLYDTRTEVSKTNETRDLNSVPEEAGTLAKVKSEAPVVSNDTDAKNKELTPASTTDKKPVAKNKRKITFKKYSRAALDEQYLKEEIKKEQKKEVRLEKKEQ